MIVGEIPEQTAADVEQKLKTKSGGEFHVPGPVPRGGPSRGPQFPPPQRFATFALRLQPFASEFRDGAHVCSENDAFFLRNGDLNFATEHTSAARTMVFFSDFLVLENFASRCRFIGLASLGLNVGGHVGHLPGSGPVDPNGTLFEPLLEPYRGTLC